jgi:hypothetical protein
MRAKKIQSFDIFNENSNISDDFTIEAQRLIDDVKKIKDDYPIDQYNKIVDLEKLIYSDSEDDKKKFVKSIMRLLGMSKWDLPNELYRYL